MNAKEYATKVRQLLANVVRAERKAKSGNGLPPDELVELQIEVTETLIEGAIEVEGLLTARVQAIPESDPDGGPMDNPEPEPAKIEAKPVTKTEIKGRE